MKAMKKTHIIFAAALSAAMSLSCQDELKPDSKNVTGDGQDGTVVLEEGQILGIIPENTYTKTAVGQDTDGVYPVVWLNRDMIKVFSDNAPDGAAYEAVVETPSSQAAFLPAGEPVQDESRYAVYPGALAQGMQEGKIIMDLSSFRTQLYHSSIHNFGAFDNYKEKFEIYEEHKEYYEANTVFPHLPMFASASGGSDEFRFANLFGAVRVNINDYQGNDIMVQSVRLITDRYVSGTMSISADGTFTLEGSSDEEKTVSVVSPKEAGQKISDSTPSLADNGIPFYFFLPAGTYNGFTFEITDTDGRIFRKSTGTVVEVEPGLVKSFPTLPLTLYYGTANSVIAQTASAFEIDITPYYTFNDRLVYDGVPVEGIEGKQYTAEVLWQLRRDGQNLDGDVLSSEPVVEGYLLKGNTNVQGNALIALKDESGETVWTFHLWVLSAEYTPEDQLYVVDGESFYMMNKNLGAIFPVIENAANAFNSYGMYYQWGRKDPLPAYGVSAYAEGVTALFDTEVKTDATIMYAMKNPLKAIQTKEDNMAVVYPQSVGNNILWGASEAVTSEDAIPAKAEGFVKTVYDPCPQGYMLPQAWHFSGLTVAREARTGYGAYLYYDGVNETYYPLQGRFLVDSNKVSGETKATGTGTDTRYHVSNPYGTTGWAAPYLRVSFLGSPSKVSVSYYFGAEGNCYPVRCLKMDMNQ